MKLSRRKGKDIHENVKVPDRKIEALNYTPVRYDFSSGFKVIANNPEAYAKEKIAKIPLKKLSDIMYDSDIAGLCDSEVDALVKLEISKACAEYVDHIHVIKKILDSSKVDILRAKEIVELIKKDREEHEVERDKYKELKDCSIDFYKEDKQR